MITLLLTLFAMFIDDVDHKALQVLFDEYDTDKDGKIAVKDLEAMLVKLGVAPMTDVKKRGSASADIPRENTQA